MVAQMFRASFRSLADPFRGHVCIPCRVNRIGAPVGRLRQFHRMPVLRDENSDSKPGSHLNDSLKSKPEQTQGSEPSNKVRKATVCSVAQLCKIGRLT